MQAKRRSWVWYFLFLLAAGAVAITTPIIFNLRQQLRHEQLDAARERWKQNGARDYDLIYEAKQDRDPQADEYRVTVRDGKVLMASINAEVMLAKENAVSLGGAIGASLGALTVPQRELSGYAVEGLFQIIAVNLKKNEESGGRNFATASFDAKDGHPIRYIYRVKRSPERLEWNVKLVRP